MDSLCVLEWPMFNTVRLHKEICDFYAFVRPRDFENNLRHDLVTRVSHFLSRNYHSCEVRYFGSFAAGLYLPNADMDLVVLSDSFVRYHEPGLPVQGGQLKKFLFKFARALETARVARRGSTLAIWKAKVPIVKYVDDLTGLRVDISFENDTGPTANKTYQTWKASFPAMPVIVTLVKQFLMMRGSNEVHTGGLGGFSVTCLVVSLLQHMPQLQSGNMDPMQNLGEILMNFFDFYGNKFDSLTIGIQLDPPMLFPKVSIRVIRLHPALAVSIIMCVDFTQHLETRVTYNPKKAWSLSIIDPNRPNNDISSGSSNVLKIFESFSEAYNVLQRRMSDVAHGRAEHSSLLAPLYEGNYTLFESQRAHLASLHPSAP
jgi:non-canonical poly(A) RNA polymerase PAPD5/7